MMTRQTKALLLALAAVAALAVLCTCSGDSDSEDAQEGAAPNNANANDNSLEPSLVRTEFPRVKGGSSHVIIHTNADNIGINYAVEWDQDKQAQRWSCYQITAANRVSTTSRYYPKDGELQYPFDPDLGSSSLYFGGNDPYWGSGYDHGHICPSADRLYSRSANIQTFYLTNMQPQYKIFNAGVWAHMEDFIRKKISTRQGDTIFVCKGGTIDRDDYIIETLPSGLIVPKYFFMAAVWKKSADWSNVGGLAFWIEQQEFDKYAKNENGKKYDLGQYVINIRELEKKTGIDFFCNMPDDIEEIVENQSVELIKNVWGPMVASLNI